VRDLRVFITSLNLLSTFDHEEKMFVSE
jgi:hypothetical protein